jgi:hypothetical protein
MSNAMSDKNMSDDHHEMVLQAIQELAAKGLIYDSGERRWSDRTLSWQIVWKATPGRSLSDE